MERRLSGVPSRLFDPSPDNKNSNHHTKPSSWSKGTSPEAIRLQAQTNSAQNSLRSHTLTASPLANASGLRIAKKKLESNAPGEVTVDEFALFCCGPGSTSSFREIFLFSFRSRTPPPLLLTRLLDFFRRPAIVLQSLSTSLTKSRPDDDEFLAPQPDPQPCSPDEIEKVRTSITDLLHCWVQSYYCDFDPEMKHTLKMFIQDASSSLSHILDLMQDNELARSKALENYFRGPPDFPTFKQALHSKQDQWGISLLEWNPAQVADQLTLIEFEIFQRIGLVDLSDRNWTKQHGGKLAPKQPNFAKATDNKAPNAQYFISQFNRMSSWAATELLLGLDLASRFSLQRWLLDVAKCCLDIGNFHTCFAIVAGMDHPAVARLRTLKQNISRDAQYRSLLERLRGLMSSRDNFFRYRTAFAARMASRQPCLPQMAVVFKDLFSLEGASPREKANDTVDLSRLARVWHIVSQVRQCQARPYRTANNADLERRLREEISRTMSDKDLRRLSLIIEPRCSEEEQQRKLMLTALESEGFL